MIQGFILFIYFLIRVCTAEELCNKVRMYVNKGFTFVSTTLMLYARKIKQRI